jgi:hypothetical protein
MVCFAFGQSGGQFGVVSGIGQVHTLIVQHGLEPRKFFVVRPFGALDLLKAGLNERAILLIRHAVACHPNDSAAFGQGAVTECLEKGRHQFAPNEVAGAAKKD